MHEVTLIVNGVARTATVPARRLLSDFIRHDLGLTGTHVGCEQGACGACTVLLDGAAVRSCLLFAVQAEGCRVTTVEGLAGDGPLTELQEGFHRQHALQCGFCTAGFLMSLEPLIRDADKLHEREIRAALAGNLCRCTGYLGIVEAVELAARELRPG